MKLGASSTSPGVTAKRARCGGSWSVETLGPINVIREVNGQFCYLFRCTKCRYAKYQPIAGAVEAFARQCKAAVSQALREES